MRKISILLALVASLFAVPAYADFTGKDASLATITFKNPAACSSVVCVPVFQIYDGTNVVTLTTAGADAVSNTLTGVPMYGRNLVFNGTTWDRWLGDATNGAFVNVKTSVLPTGAGTSANQTTINTSLGTINTTLGTLATHADAIAPVPAGTNNIGAVSSAPNVTATACSGTIATGNTAQNAFTAQTTLHGFTIANIDTTEPLWISFTTTAAASGTDSYPLPAATASTFAGFGSFTSPPGFGLNHALSVVAATTSHKFSCTWW